MNKKQRELLEVLVDKHTNGERLDMLDKNTKDIKENRLF